MTQHVTYEAHYHYETHETFYVSYEAHYLTHEANYVTYEAHFLTNGTNT